VILAVVSLGGRCGDSMRLGHRVDLMVWVAVLTDIRRGAINARLCEMLTAADLVLPAPADKVWVEIDAGPGICHGRARRRCEMRASCIVLSVMVPERRLWLHVDAWSCDHEQPGAFADA
jgi:hypothetical protein